MHIRGPIVEAYSDVAVGTIPDVPVDSAPICAGANFGAASVATWDRMNAI